MKVSDKEMLMKIRTADKNAHAMRAQKEHQVPRTERLLSAEKKVEGELKNWRPLGDENIEVELPANGISLKVLKKSHRRKIIFISVNQIQGPEA